MLFICYPKCSTCKKAKKFLLDHQIEFDERHIVEEKLNKDELKALYLKSGLPLKRFFNTSGNLYKEKHLKDVLPTLSEDEQLELLSTNGMLVKRPILETKDKVLVGFKEDQYKELLCLLDIHIIVLVKMFINILMIKILKIYYLEMKIVF